MYGEDFEVEYNVGSHYSLDITLGDHIRYLTPLDAMEDMYQIITAAFLKITGFE